MNAYFSLPDWRKCADPDLNIEDFKGQRCIIGLDLASKIDLAALVFLFPQDDGSFITFGKYYLPEATVRSSERDHYRAWKKEGWLTVAGDEVTDFSHIRDDILIFSSLYDVQEVAYDPTQAHWLVTELGKHNVKMIEFRPNLMNLSEPMKQLDALIRSKNIRHNGDPVAAWSLGNVVARETGGDNVYPRKVRSENKIDPTVALITALGRALLQPPKPEYKVYFV
jgi:phage terminase large subunit-like protein